jgi:ppGpp synthetase/RelA/SpoT-type nucleotidyltranferase
MAQKLTASQLNKLGERLRKGQAEDNDIRALNDFRESFRPAFDKIVAALESLGLEVGGRSAKTIGSIVAKLEREKTRLSTMQDIAGCRVQVQNRIEQDRFVEQIVKMFPSSKIDDRRVKPSHGYRAVHVVANVGGSPVEIQVRTVLQNMWAQATERVADRFDPAIKYGDGPEFVQKILQDFSDVLNGIEEVEFEALGVPEAKAGLLDRINHHKERLRDALGNFIVEIEKLREE